MVQRNKARPVSDAGRTCGDERPDRGTKRRDLYTRLYSLNQTAGIVYPRPIYALVL